MFWRSIRQKIVGIAIGLIILMVVTSVLSIAMATRVGRLLDELTTKYVPAYGHLARANVRSLERALALRRMVIAKMQVPPDEAGYAARRQDFEQLSPEVEREAQAARKLIISIIEDVSTPSDNAALARIETRIDVASTDLRHRMNEEMAQLLTLLEARDFEQAGRNLVRVDQLRDEFTQKIDAVRADMLTQVFASASTVIADQKRAIIVTVIVTALAALLGLIFAVLVSSGITRPVRLLLEGTRDVEAGRLGHSITITTQDEIGQLSLAFNRMIEQLRRNERVRETFGRYIDPQVVKGLLDQPALAAAEGQRRTMTVLFCDMKAFATLSEGVTPQGLVKVMNRYLSTMSEPIRHHRGIIDKYIGDAIMAYWGPPFVEEADQARLACLAAIDMVGRVATLRKEIPELLGVRNIPVECDVRIGIATGEALVGSIGSEFMMSYTVMGDNVNLASRLETANKEYGSHVFASEATARAAGPEIETREIDRVVVAGQSQAAGVFEIMGRKGELTPQAITLRSAYAEGLAAYRAQRWDDARRAFKAALESAPGDGPALALLNRIERLQQNPPAADWDGAWHLQSK
ncbi:MAG: HAMP domain-containing protein [Xanthobacteraceae bacterium]|nr:HAMP domain-containing protein [Xanthobacteraceae bacterium]